MLDAGALFLWISLRLFMVEAASMLELHLRTDFRLLSETAPGSEKRDESAVAVVKSRVRRFCVANRPVTERREDGLK